MNFFGADSEESNPIQVAKDWVEFARREGEIEVEAMHLATVDADGLPNVRVVYAREIDETGFIFFTNYESQKGRELASGKVAFNMFYVQQSRQLRVRGIAEKLSNAKSDQYFHNRREGSRVGAWVSKQSHPLVSREILLNEWKKFDRNKAASRPPFWGGYRILPLEIEFFQMGEFRLHDRFQWQREDLDKPWLMSRLYP